MSSDKLSEVTQPIYIIYKPQKKHFQSVSPQKPQYNYTLILNNDNYINKTSYNTYAHLITHKDKYKFTSLKTYKIIIYDIDTTYSLEGNINNNTISNENEHLFIEFIKTNIGHTLCSCFIKNSNIIVSPPNF